MKRAVAVYAIIVAVCLFSSCGLRSGIEISSTNFSDVISPQQNLEFVFNERVVADSLVGKWDTTAYLAISPQVTGMYKWVTPTQLTFSPRSQFAPSTSYTATLTTALLGKGAAKNSLGRNISEQFHTPFLALDGCEAYWTKVEERGGAVELRLNTKFNYDVRSQQVADLLNVKHSSATLRHVSLAATDNTEALYAIQDGFDALDDATITLTVAPGLQTAGSDWKTKEPMTLDVHIPSRKVLEITDCYSEYDEAHGVIRCITSQPVENNSIESSIQIVPELKFSAELSESGFVVKGEFKPGTSYSITVKNNLRGVLGGVMSEDFNKLVNFGALRPEIAFTEKKAMYLSPNSSRNLGIRITSVPEIKVTVYRIYENNIQGFLREARRYWYDDSYDYYSSDGDDDGSDYEQRYAEKRKGGYGDFGLDNDNLDNFGTKVSSRTYSTRSLPKAGNISLLNLSLENISEYKGVYVVKVESDDEQYLQASKLVAVSDVGLIAKHSDNDVWVFCNSIKTAEPVKGVSVSFLSTNNQVVQTVTSDASGVAKFTDVLSKAKDFRVGMITTRYQGDFNYMLFADTKVETSRFDVGGLQENTSGLQAFLYGERDAYRPGETIHCNTIIRDTKWNSPGPLPVKLKILMPDGKEYRTLRQTLSAEGSAATDIPTSNAMPTGTYHMEVHTMNDVLLTSRAISLEEFTPDRIKVNLSMNKQAYSMNDSVIASVNAMNYYGPPAALRNYEFTYILSRTNFQPKGIGGYTFWIRSKNTNKVHSKTESGKTDANGNARAVFAIPPEYVNTGMLNAKVFAAVMDETGRPVSRMQTFDVSTQDVFFGIKAGDSYIDVGRGESVPVIAVNKEGKSVAANARVQVIHTTWETVMKKNDYGSFNYVSEERNRIISDKNVSIGAGGTSVGIAPKASGTYRLRIMPVNSENYVEREYFAYGWGSTTSSSFEVKREGTVDISFDKEQYTVGEKATVLFKTPFAGKLLVTTERNGVKNYQYLNTDQKSAIMTITVTDEMVPNVYVSATLFKPLDNGAMPLSVAHGYAPLICNQPSSRIPVVIEAADRSKSNTKQTIKVKALSGQQCEMTIAVVDEGVLAIRRTKSPDPHGYFYQRRALQVNSYDVYPYLFPDLKPGKFAYGAGDDEMASRLSPVLAKRFNLVAYWSGIVQSNGSGEATYTIDIPQFSGSLRIMAVAYKGKSFGAAEKNMTVADPVVVTAGLPRFMSPGDTIQVPVTLANTTSKQMYANASVSVGSLFKVVGSTQQGANLQPNAEQRVMFSIAALNSIGQSTIDVSVKAGAESYTDRTEIAVRPASPLIKNTGNGSVADGKSTSMKLVADFMSGTAKARLVVSKSPIAEFGKSFIDLVEYPYGCVEQTTSKAFPQIYLADFMPSVAKGVSANARTNVQEAINKLQSMQLYNGGLSYWQGGNQESWWGTAYAAHFLIEAQRNGYDVNERGLQRMTQYLATKAQVKEHVEYGYFDAAGTTKKRMVIPQEVCYSLYVLALAGKQDVSLMNFYKSSLASLTEDSRFMLALSYLTLGDKANYQKITIKQFTEFSAMQLGGSFGSYLRDEALVLSALVDNDFSNPQVNSMARHLSQQIRSRKWLSTQELGFAFVALGKLARKTQSANATATIEANGKTYNLTTQDVVIDDGLANRDVKISAKGGTVYYFWETRGVSATNTMRQEDAMLKIRRTFLDRNGAEIRGTTFNQNDLIVVKLTLSSPTRAFLDNIVISDLLPSGFEIENPRISEVPELTWAKNATIPASIDYRDDRINLFTSVGTEDKVFYYVVRAITPGTFRLAPAAADAMYNGDFHSYNGGGTITIKQ
ncbi:MAG: Ig-like domain-containing protein [Candidatus Kapabacteria bacterium]|nr:Ig-like domain-containing protein [Candidatus Kapabacteria bacterium]